MMPPCSGCGHDEHFLPCIAIVVTRALGGVRRDRCGCTKAA